MATRRSIKAIADRLISTLDTTMPTEQADAIVRDCAEELYTDLLQIKGKVVVDPTAPIGTVHGGFGPNGKKAVLPIVKFRFEPKR